MSTPATDIPCTNARAPQPLAVAACLCVYLLFCLQQVVLTGRYFGVGLSLGSMAIRAFVLGVSLWALWRQGLPPILRRPLLGIIACLVSLGASLLASERPELAFKFAMRYATALLALWAMLNLALACPRWPRAATLAALIALWWNLVLGLAVRLHWPPALRLSLAFHAQDSFKYLPRISGMYEHPALLAASAVLVAGLVLQYWRSGQMGRLALGTALLGAVLALALTEVRNPLLPVGALLLWWAWPRHSASRVRRRAAVLGLLGLLALAGFVMWKRYADMTSAVHESTLTAVSLGRTYLWAGALEAWRSHPWFGLGPGVFQFLVPDYTGGRFDRGELHAHNLLLAVLSETGLCGLLAGLGLLYALWAPLLRSASVRGWALTWLLLLLGLGVFDFYLPFYAFSLHAALALAVLYARLPVRNGTA
ncbi:MULTISPECIES: O-antigen ligase family protein [Pseudoxanthomonas]|uniref:O-antigen ligase n=1 Tax=Pseudoxanthomonas winnipegensis TaxID=2480810 RepID=A0AAW8G941_9GAMM|nr:MULTISPECIES: O-antigen ligase family protein [Pseudoxanthomonas]MDQ1118945.1 O-antigen ligase [Pseudoxanthomonas winnipegensis]MDQ1132133.1 O-antigen ligase [Pseudoxanthomonas winnipegensis]MDR6137855.1 O-antigen ligase [Pseudoxanthomonas sp. SORGH_AS_0997]